MPNLYGAQRFGARGDNAARGRDVLAGRLRLRGQELRFLVSALQSELFNQYTHARREDGLLGHGIEGDIMRKVPGGGLFPTTDLAADQPRLDAGEIVPTGPMFGHAMRAPAPGTAAATREATVLAAAGLATADFARPWIKRVAEGTRRPLTVIVADGAVSPSDGDGDAVVISFTLPSGSFATVCLAEVLGHPIASATLSRLGQLAPAANRDPASRVSPEMGMGLAAGDPDGDPVPAAEAEEAEEEYEENA